MHLSENQGAYWHPKSVDDAQAYGVNTQSCHGRWLFAVSRFWKFVLVRFCRGENGIRRVSAIRCQVLSRSSMAYLALNPARATVLVVDDSPEMQRYLRVILEIDSYQVEIASNGQDALQIIRRGCTPQLVLLDLEMPGMDGIETLRRMRELRPQLKVIMCSGVDDPDKILEAGALGALAFLVKPIQHLYLSAAIERCLRGSAKRASGHFGTHLVLPSTSPL